MQYEQQLSGQIIDLFQRKIYPGTVVWKEGRITEVREETEAPEHFILPGFIDAHIHIESSMLTPYEFASMALPHGTVATVSDPHEIANVCGIEGVNYMLRDAEDALLKFCFGAPSCVPATAFETAGAVLDSSQVEILLRDSRIGYLAEMMNYPGVLNGDEEVLKKIALAKKYGKPVDGHAPGMRGDDAAKYIAAGISTDHECFTKEEALDKLQHGMKILIREGSAAKNYEALHTLIDEFPEEVMLCSDDKHPDDLIHGHIDALVRRAINDGHELFNVLRAACLNPVQHYKLSSGLLRKGDAADFIVVEDLRSFRVLQTWINGKKAAEKGNSFLPRKKHLLLNHFFASVKKTSDFNCFPKGDSVRVIQALDGQLITNEIHVAKKDFLQDGNNLASTIEKDLLKITVVNRYKDVPPACAFIHGFGLKRGAIAGTVAHDSHNIIAIGTTDEEICKAVNTLIEHTGGLCAVDGNEILRLPLPIAGLMSDRDGHETGNTYSTLDAKVKAMGSTLRSPYMTLSFMALLVIPSLKLSDKGLFDALKWKLVISN